MGSALRRRTNSRRPTAAARITKSTRLPPTCRPSSGTGGRSDDGRVLVSDGFLVMGLPGEGRDRLRASGRLTVGEEVAAFEREFADFHGLRHGIMVNSGSSANLVAVAALFHVKQNPLKQGDQALVPALAWATTYAPLVQHGLDLVLVDCDEGWNADPYALKDVEARLVVGCSILGNPAQLDTWRTIAGVHDAYLLEDNCESLGASIGGKLCGTFGLMSTFSFYYSHQISAIEGGMILTDDDECATLCRLLRDHGMTRHVEKPKTFEAEYDFRLFGYNVFGFSTCRVIPWSRR